MDERIVQRINVLAKKAKEEGLSEQEIKERDELRQKYLKEFKEGFGSMLENITIIEPDGSKTDVKDLKRTDDFRKDN